MRLSQSFNCCVSDSPTHFSADKCTIHYYSIAISFAYGCCYGSPICLANFPFWFALPLLLIGQSYHKYLWLLYSHKHHGLRGRASFSKKFDQWIYYIKNCSLSMHRRSSSLDGFGFQTLFSGNNFFFKLAADRTLLNYWLLLMKAQPIMKVYSVNCSNANTLLMALV